MLKEIADLSDIPTGAFNIRSDSQSIGRRSTENIEIVSKTGVSGMDIFIKPGVKGETVHIPVVMTASGLKETVYNDFFIGDNADVDIVAGCGIDNCGAHDSQHDGIHRFYVGKNSRVRYVEKHFGSGSGAGSDAGSSAGAASPPAIPLTPIPLLLTAAIVPATWVPWLAGVTSAVLVMKLKLASGNTLAARSS